MGRCPVFGGLGLWQRYGRGGSLESWVGLPNGSIRECSTLLSRDRLALRLSSHEATELKWCVSLRRDGGKLWIGMDRGVPVDRETPVPAVVVVDDGRYWFELRAITWRGCLV